MLLQRKLQNFSFNCLYIQTFYVQKDYSMKKNTLITITLTMSLISAALSAAIFSSCAMDEEDDVKKSIVPGDVVLSAGTAAGKSLSGTSVRLAFMSTIAGTYYLLAEPAQEAVNPPLSTTYGETAGALRGQSPRMGGSERPQGWSEGGIPPHDFLKSLTLVNPPLPPTESDSGGLPSEALPEASGVKNAGTGGGKVAHNGTLAQGHNAVSVTGLTCGQNYNIFLVAEDSGGLSAVYALSNVLPTALDGIAGSEWYMGNGRLTFKADGHISLHGFNYDYNYDAVAKTGWVSGNRYNRTETFDGKQQGDIINMLGNFTVNTADDGASITFNNYRDSGFEVTYTNTPQFVPEDRLTGTAWSWPSLELEFLPNGKVLQFSTTGYYPHPHIYKAYTYNPALEVTRLNGTKETIEAGYIDTAERLCSYSPANTPLGWFVIMHNFKTENNVTVDACLYFPGPESRFHAIEPFNQKGYKNYGHRADFVRRTDE
jgi:hypothetical protein